MLVWYYTNVETTFSLCKLSLNHCFFSHNYILVRDSARDFEKLNEDDVLLQNVWIFQSLTLAQRDVILNMSLPRYPMIIFNGARKPRKNALPDDGSMFSSSSKEVIWYRCCWVVSSTQQTWAVNPTTIKKCNCCFPVRLGIDLKQWISLYPGRRPCSW